MKTARLKVARIGNSRGVRIPATTLERYGIGETVLMEERSDGILLKPVGKADAKLSWEETALAMTRDAAEWGSWDVTAGDGLSEIVWPSARPARRVAEGVPAVVKGRRKSRKK